MWVITDRTSTKGAALESAGRFTIVAQTEDLPYRYVSVEGPIVQIRRCEHERDLVPMSVRYLGEAVGRVYAEQFAGDTTLDVYVMKPEHWRSADLTEPLESVLQSVDQPQTAHK